MSFHHDETELLLENNKHPDCQDVLDERNPILPCYKCPDLLECQFRKMFNE